PQVTWDLTAGNQEKKQCADAAHQDRHVGVKTHQDGCQHCGTKHGNQVLHPHDGGLWPWQPFIWPDDTAAAQGIFALFIPREHGNPFIVWLLEEDIVFIKPARFYETDVDFEGRLVKLQLLVYKKVLYLEHSASSALELWHRKALN